VRCQVRDRFRRLKMDVDVDAHGYLNAASNFSTSARSSVRPCVRYNSAAR
jgi:hypothetical protein